MNATWEKRLVPLRAGLEGWADWLGMPTVVAVCLRPTHARTGNPADRRGVMGVGE